MSFVAFTGNSDYCFANSLHMSLLAARADKQDLPEPGFLECLTTMPFGKMYLQLDNGGLAFFNSAEMDPDNGLTLAIRALGWSCREQRGGPSHLALTRLREAVKQAPALVGPVDVGYLTYNPSHTYLGGTDHFIMVMAIEDDHVLIHDPWKYPYARLSIPEFMKAWHADKIDYKQGPYTFRAHFQLQEKLTRQEMIQRVLPTIRENLRLELDGPQVYNGVAALRMLAEQLRAPHRPKELQDMLTAFVFPLAGKRSLDAAAFLSEANLPEGARAMEQQALLVGHAQYLGIHKRWPEVAGIIDQLLTSEQQLIEALA
ncbi:hypothetical protein [Dictyobacter kobayashii]|uniref:Butirosin biosynthesis protein H N-terminal domain-containing protein n=1 Tax=Dictyobacter kobayashii TaxID=2014872 RepID=A0A402AU95_9CHLR|nr:hypothetical protein [Dictyobacter kobayashii]GCE22688.1 hypothetical protein KDK_64880 [Dictyobacter kobayashii]